MFFTIKARDNNQSTQLLTWKVLKQARKSILFYRTGSTEIAINNYLKTKYNSNLKIACLYLISKTKILKNNNGQELIITFTTPFAEKLARLITYGNGVFQGSQILKKAFSYYIS